MAHIYWTQWGWKKVRACSVEKPITEISTVVWFNGCDIINSITAHYGISHDEYVYSHTHSIYRCLRHLQTLEAKVLLKSLFLFAQLSIMTTVQWPHCMYIFHLIYSV